MSFGPVNGEGGERRRNVLFSRARTRCLVFCSCDPSDIDTARTSRDGPRVLKRFLEFARSGELAQPEVTVAPADNPIEMAFSKLKAHLRRIGARTLTDMFNALAGICELYSPNECWTYFMAAGYVAC